MTDEKWEELKGKVKEEFGAEEEVIEGLGNKPGEVEIIVFNGPLGKIKLARTTRPMVIDKKTQYSRRIGGEVGVEYVYSETEKIHEFTISKWDEGTGQWEEMKMTEEFNL